jgi:hypothetical protein
MTDNDFEAYWQDEDFLALIEAKISLADNEFQVFIQK